jgi:S-adenosylmethionine/arginine decarboxylase-like enzyme
MLYWGKHLLINAYKANSNVLCKNTITNFSNELVIAIDMIPYGKPQVIHFGDDNKKGYTLNQLITTSNITGHFCDTSKDFYLDVFSCKEYDEKIVCNLINKYFQPLYFSSKIIYRDSPTDAHAHDLK